MSQPYVHPAAICDCDDIGQGTRIWAYAHVLSGAHIGQNCNVADHVFVEGGAWVGDNVTLKNNVCVWEGVRLEDDVFVGPNVTFTNDRYPRSPRMMQARERYSEKENWLSRTIVRQGAAIGGGATITPGIELGRYCLVAAGALVTHNVEPFSIVAGVTATHAGYVCTCGHRLSGHYAETDCDACGELAITRALLADSPRILT